MKRIKRMSMAMLLSATLIGGSMVGLVSAAGPYNDEPNISSTGQWLTSVSTYAGTGEFSDADGALDASSFRMPQGIVALQDGSLVVSDAANHVLRKIKDGQVSVFAGITLEVDGKGMPIGGMLDGSAIESFFQKPNGLAVDFAGNIYVADTENHAVRKVSSKGDVTTLAGNGVSGSEDGIGKSAHFHSPLDIAVAYNGVVYVADTLNHLIRKITPSGKVTTLNAPSTRIVEVFSGVLENAGDFKDGKLSEAMFNEPSGIALDAMGNLYVSDTGNQRIRYIDFETNIVSTVAGGAMAEDGMSLYEDNELYALGDFADGAAESALFNFPRGITVMHHGAVLITDTINHSVRSLHNGVVSTIAGHLDQRSGQDNGIDRRASFQNPTDVIELPNRDIMITDSFNNRIREITPYELPAISQLDHFVKVMYDREEIIFDTEPELFQDRTMVPINAIATALGFRVNWLETERLVQLDKDGITIQLEIGSLDIARIYEDGSIETHEMDVAPYIKDNRTFVPVRFFAEEIGLDVHWIGEERAVVIR